jgi:flagellar assembly protein FliH
MRESTRFIPGEEIETAAPWDFAAVDTASLLLAQQAKARDEAAEAARAEVARQQGFADGFIQGQAQAAQDAQKQITDFVRNQGQESARIFARLFETAQTGLDDARQTISQGVLELACELARQILRQELSINPNNLLPVIREAIGLLIGDSKGAVVKLNPVDLEVLHEVLESEFAMLSLKFLPDPAIDRGGCQVESAGTVIDGTLGKRWARAVANLGLEVSWADDGDVD